MGWRASLDSQQEAPNMRANLLILILAVIPAMLSSGSYLTSARPAGIFSAAQSDISGRAFLPQNETQAGFDLNYCQHECRSRFGLEFQSDIQEHFRGGSGRGAYYAYANCIAACNARFWREFDNNTRDLERLR